MWDLNQLKTELKRNPRIKSWAVTQEHVRRRERYFMTDARNSPVIDQDRDVQQQNITVRLAVRLEQLPDRQGEISKKLFPSMPLSPQIESAVESALQTDHKSWELPSELPANLPQLQTTDPRMAEDLDRVVDEVSERISALVRKSGDTTFNSAELFMSVHDRELHLSNGLHQRGSQSRIYVETAYSFARVSSRGETESDEYLNTRWAVSLDDLALERMFEESSDRARHSLGLEKPLSGSYPVIVDAEVLSALFSAYVSQLSSSSAYNELPFIKAGEELIPGAHADLLTLTLDPSLPFGADTTALSDQGILQAPLRLVQDNQVLAALTDKQYADYLGTSPTTSRGNLVVEAGKMSHDELARSAPRVLEILQFSGLFTDPFSGTFSSEIRLARLHDNVKGEVSYLKGGSLSGSIRDNFKGARLSRERVKRAHFESNAPHGHGYFGPEHALLSDVSVVG